MAGHRRIPVSDEWYRPAGRLPFWLAVTAVALGVLSIALPNIAPGVEFMSAEGSPVRRFFGLYSEMNLPTFFSVMVLVAAACAHGFAGTLARGQVRPAFFVTAALLLALGFDDFAGLHERLDTVGQAIAPEGFSGPRYVWILPALGIAAVVVLAFWRLVTRLRGSARRDMLLGIVVFFVAAMGIETINGYLDRPGTNGMPLQVGTHVEEVTENLGMILVLRGALAMFEVSRTPNGLSVRISERSLVSRPVGRPEDDDTVRLPTQKGVRPIQP